MLLVISQEILLTIKLTILQQVGINGNMFNWFELYEGYFFMQDVIGDGFKPEGVK